MVVAFATDLLAFRQQRFDATQVDERVARVRLLDDAGHDITDTIDVLVEHHLALSLANALQNNLFGGLGGDPPEVVGADVDLFELVLVVCRPVDFGRRRHVVLGRTALRPFGFDDRQRARLLVLVEHELQDAHVALVAIDEHAGELCRVRCLLVRGKQSVLERKDQRFGADAFFAFDHLDCLEDLPVHGSLLSTTRARWIALVGIHVGPSAVETSTRSDSTAVKVPLTERARPAPSLTMRNATTWPIALR